MPAPTASLTPLQRKILELLADLEPPFVLVGGGAIAGFYFGHRLTRDLDLFWRERPLLGELPREIQRRLAGADLVVESLQTAPQFHRFSVEAGSERCVLDLVAEPASFSESPTAVALGRVRIFVEAPLALLAEKLCALLGRAEPRDLDDVGRLLDAGTDLRAALALAPSIDGGFSALTLAWVLDRLELQRIAAASGYDGPRAQELEALRKDLIERLISELPPAHESS